MTADDDGPAAVAVKLRGNPDHPYSAGELCPKVNRFIDRVYDPQRAMQHLGWQPRHGFGSVLDQWDRRAPQVLAPQPPAGDGGP